MHRLASVIVVFALSLPAQADDKTVTVTFLGGAKKVPLGGLRVAVRTHTGDWTKDHKAKPLATGTTDKDGTARFALAEGSYYVEAESDTERPYLDTPVGYTGDPGAYGRYIRVGTETRFAFNLADACRLTLRAVDADTGKGIPGVSFSMESETGELRDVVLGDNLGADHRKQRAEVTDADGYLTRFVGPHAGYTYFAAPTPPGYEVVGSPDASIPTPFGTATAGHVFKFKKR